MNMLAVGVLAGMIVSALAPGWVKALTFAGAAVITFKLLRLHPSGHLHLMVPPLLIALAGVAFGLWSWHYARKRGLEHLGEYELRNRWANVRGISKWGF